MIWFLNNENVNLLKYLPFFMQEYREIRNIMETENPEFNLFWEKLREIFGNQFIEYCNEEGISKFEKMLGIYHDESDILENRIVNVLFYWNNQIKYTWRVLIEQLNRYCGSPDMYNLSLDNNRYILNINTYFENDLKYHGLNILLRNTIPANLGINSINVIPIKTEDKLYIGIGIVTTVSNYIE